MTTFADLMAVLVVFFVMLYAFSTIDVQRYEQLASSLREVLGPSVVGDDRRRAAPTVVDFDGAAPVPQPVRIEDIDPPEYTERDAIRDALQEALAEEIEAGLIALGEADEGVLLRFEEQAAFAIGSDVINAKFLPVLEGVAAVLADTPGTIHVAGHSDDLPIRTERFRSNFELSAARAVSVVHVFAEAGVPRQRLVAQGHADTRPLAPNTNAENRARNRRVDVFLTESAQLEPWPEQESTPQPE